MTKEELVNLLRITGVGENAVVLASNAFDAGVEWEREECAKMCDESEYPDGIDLAHLIRARGQE